MPLKTLAFFLALFLSASPLLPGENIPEEIVNLPLGTKLRDFQKKFPEAHYDNSTGMYYIELKKRFVVEAGFEFRNIFNKKAEGAFLGVFQPKLLEIVLWSNDKFLGSVTKSDTNRFLEECKTIWGKKYRVKIATFEPVSEYPKDVVVVWELAEGGNVYLSFIPEEELERVKDTWVHRSSRFQIVITVQAVKEVFPKATLRDLNKEEKQYLAGLDL